ncbi:anticodon-binding aminoacyl-tRNA synthetase, class 1a, partial [Tanacetum coccineum]
VLYKESKKRFAEDAEFRERALQGKSLYDSYISKTLNLLREKGFNIDSEGVFGEGQKLPLVDLAALWHAVDMVKADWVVHVTDVEQQDYIEMCIIAAKQIVNDLCHHSFSHVGFGVEGDDFERFVNLVYLLDEAKSRCKAILVGQGKADKWTTEKLEHTAEALGYGAVKYANLKNHRFTNCTLNFDEMLNEKGNTVVYLQFTLARVWSITRKSRNKIKKLKVKEVEELILKNDTERELGIHLLRFTEILEEVCKVVMPHILCDYLFDLCEKFDRLYYSVCEEDKSDGSGEKTDEETSKLLLYEATAVVMKKCFHLLGITPIYKI